MLSISDLCWIPSALHGRGITIPFPNGSLGGQESLASSYLDDSAERKERASCGTTESPDLGTIDDVQDLPRECWRLQLNRTKRSGMALRRIRWVIRPLHYLLRNRCNVSRVEQNIESPSPFLIRGGRVSFQGSPWRIQG